MRAKGFSLSELKKIGHDLECSMGYCVTRGIENLCIITDQEKMNLSLLNVYYKAKHFEYRVTGGQILPNLQDLISFGKKLLESIHSTCYEHYEMNTSKSNDFNT